MNDTLTLSLVQTQLHWEDVAANLAMLEQKIKGIQHTEVVVLPEMFSTGFSMEPERLAETMDGAAVNWMKRVATENKIVLTGSLMIEEHRQYYNRLIWMLPNGQFGYYDKRHRFAYAGEDKHYTAGNKRFMASVKGWKINLQVCYDLRFPVWARQQFDRSEETHEYDVLVYVANWPERRNHAWKTLLTARAIENQCYVVGVNRVGNDGKDIYHSGDSMVLNALGETLYHKAHDEEVHTITIDKPSLNEIRSKIPFLKDGDSFHLLND